MRRLLGLLFCMGLCLGAAAPARAGHVFSFTVNSALTNMSGELFTDDEVNGSYLITGIAGTIDGLPIAGIEPVGTNTILRFFPTDNLLFASGALLSGGGFIVDPGSSPGSIAAHAPVQVHQALSSASSLPGVFLYEVTAPGGPTAPATIEVFEIIFDAPEPASLALLTAGVVPLALRRRRRA